MIGVTDLIIPDYLKKQSLLFDKFTHPFGQVLYNQDIEGHERYQAEIAWLYENGVIVDLSHEVENTTQKNIIQTLEPFMKKVNLDFAQGEMISIAEKMKADPSQVEQLLGIPPGLREQKLDSVYDLLKHINNEDFRYILEACFTLLGNTVPSQARSMAAFLRDQKNISAFPLLSEFTSIFAKTVQTTLKTREGDVVSIVLKRLPSPDESVSWEHIVEYRNDPDSKGKMLALRNWMHEVARSNLTHQEIEDKLDWLIYDYERHLDLHNMKYKTGILETVLTVGAEFLESVIKIKWGKAAKTLFSMKHQRIALLEAEMGNPGSEVAYIANAREHFE